MKTVLFVGAGRHQRRAILQARERGLRVVAVDRNPDAPGLAAADVPETVDFTHPGSAAVRALRGSRSGIETVGAPAVLNPADSGGQRGVFRIDSRDALDGHLHAALAESRSGEAIVESFVDGVEMNGIVIA